MNRRDRLRFFFVFTACVFLWVCVCPASGEPEDASAPLRVVFQVDDQDVQVQSEESDAELKLIAGIMLDRLNRYLGLQVQRAGKDMIVVSLSRPNPDPGKVLRILGTRGQLDLREVLNITPAAPPAPQRQNYEGDLQFEQARERWSKAMESLRAASVDLIARAVKIEGAVVAPAQAAGSEEAENYYLLGPTLLSGKYIERAEVKRDSLGRAGVLLSFDAEGRKLFEDVTARLTGRQVAFVFDNVVISAPVVHDRISGGRAQITGRFTAEEASDMALILNSGALPASVKRLSVPAQLLEYITKIMQ